MGLLLKALPSASIPKMGMTLTARAVAKMGSCDAQTGKCLAKCFKIVLLMEGNALVKPHNVDDDDNDCILFVFRALSLPKCFPAY